MTHSNGYSIVYPKLDGTVITIMARERLLLDHAEAIMVVVDLFSEVARQFTGAADWPKMRASVRAGIIDALAAARVGTEPVTFELTDGHGLENAVSITFPLALCYDEGILLTDRGRVRYVTTDGPRWTESIELIDALRREVTLYSSAHPGMTFTRCVTPYGPKYPKYKAL